mmetsp:Transcript_1963/g.4863  ORF Transcript_1963/g.4863 Transcript_1963/m.4863 type:complete len:251 (-) Transcript_1963:486-1238(-)
MATQHLFAQTCAESFLILVSISCRTPPPTPYSPRRRRCAKRDNFFFPPPTMLPPSTPGAEATTPSRESRGTPEASSLSLTTPRKTTSSNGTLAAWENGSAISGTATTPESFIAGTNGAGPRGGAAGRGGTLDRPMRGISLKSSSPENVTFDGLGEFGALFGGLDRGVCASSISQSLLVKDTLEREEAAEVTEAVSLIPPSSAMSSSRAANATVPPLFSGRIIWTSLSAVVNDTRVLFSVELPPRLTPSLS